MILAQILVLFTAEAPVISWALAEKLIAPSEEISYGSPEFSHQTLRSELQKV